MKQNYRAFCTTSAAWQQNAGIDTACFRFGNICGQTCLSTHCNYNKMRKATIFDENKIITTYLLESISSCSESELFEGA